MGFIDWFRPKPKVSAPVSVICQCPGCGKNVCIVFTAGDGTLEAVEKLAHGGPGRYSTTDSVAAEIARRREEREKVPSTRIYDKDHRAQPEV